MKKKMHLEKLRIKTFLLYMELMLTLLKLLDFGWQFNLPMIWVF